ncbi:MAG TPA: ATP cone domain-containing protein, partial [Verrucomicrobiae bacterium]|nr:ATP cone domain-containing protein [Verrucomicrobiae bacterium]
MNAGFCARASRTGFPFVVNGGVAAAHRSPDMLHEQLDGQLRLVQLDPLKDQTFLIRKRDGRVVPFDETRIQLAIEFAFKADAGLHADQTLPAAAQGNVIRVANAVIQATTSRGLGGATLEIECIQDLVETQLMEAGHHSIARRYLLYREERRKARALRGER